MFCTCKRCKGEIPYERLTYKNFERIMFDENPGIIALRKMFKKQEVVEAIKSTTHGERNE